MPTVTYNWVTATSSFFLNNTFTAGAQNSVAIGAVHDGTGYLSVWDHQGTALEGRIVGSNGSPAGGEFLVNSTTAGAQTDSSVAGLTGGSMVVTFTDYSVDAGGDVRARLFTSAGAAVDLDFGVVTATNDDSDSDVAALADGGFVVTWTRDFGMGDRDIRAAVYNNDGSVRTALLPVDAATDSASHAQVIGLQNGNFVVVWEKEAAAGGPTSVWFRIFDSSGAPVTSAAVMDAVGSINEDAQIVALRDGGFAVAHTDNGWSAGADTDITLRIYDADGTVRTADWIRVNTTTAADQERPTLTTLSNGYIVVGFQHGDLLYYQAYTPLGEAVGGNAAMGGSVVEAEIAGLSGGLIAASISSFAPDTGGDGSVRTSIRDLVRTSTGDATNETIAGDGLRDIINGAGGDDTLDGGANNDQLSGGTGHDFLVGGLGDDELIGGDGIDTAYYAAATGYVRVNLNIAGPQNTVSAGLDTLTGIERVVGSLHNDRLYGNSGGNGLVGGEGNDYLNGADGDDQVGGAEGDDYIWLGEGYDYGWGGEGNDRLVGYNGDDWLQGQDGDDRIYGGNNNDELNGGSGNDSLFGEADNDILYGGDGDDYIDASFGNDTFHGDGGADQLRGGGGVDVGTGGDGNDRLYGGDANDTLSGGADNDLVFGEGGIDTLNGDTGNDNLFGGAGSDVLTGGAGADLFRMDSPSGVDTVTDFVAADDGIALNASVFTAFTSNGVLSASAFRVGSGAADSNDRIIYNQATGRIYYDADGVGGAGQVFIATVTAGTILTSADFVVYGASGSQEPLSAPPAHHMPDLLI